MRNFLMQSSSGLINIHELRWLGDWLVVPVGGRGRHAHSSAAAFVRTLIHSVQSATVEDIHSVMQQKPHFDAFSSRNHKQ